MSVNRHLPHILVLPEDDANRQLANGFLLNLSTRQMQVMVEAGGWPRVRDRFTANYVGSMRSYEHQFIVLLVDFDGQINRLESMQAVIPEDLIDRVFVIGSFTEPEALRRAGLGSYEMIGRSLADDCRHRTQAIWSHELLRHNEAELERLRATVCGVLFDS
jgi:hypothetical protein